VSYVTLADYEAWVGPIADAADVNRATVSLDAACDTVRQYICQTIDLVEDDVIEVTGSGTHVILLPELPVGSVSSVQDEDAEEVDDWVLQDSGRLWLDTGWRHNHLYSVTYSHGWAAEEVPSDIKITTYRMAGFYAREALGQAVSTESIGGYSVGYTTPGEAMRTGAMYQRSPLLALEKRIIKRVPTP
jgi:hypothetical protein